MSNPITAAILYDQTFVVTGTLEGMTMKVLVMIYGEAIDMMNTTCSNTIATSGRNMSKDGEPS
jgi:hypothetical protein